MACSLICATSTRVAAQHKIDAYRKQYADNQNISFLPAIRSTSNRTHGEFLRFLFLKTNRKADATSLKLECHHRNTTRTSSVFATQRRESLAPPPSFPPPPQKKRYILKILKKKSYEPRRNFLLPQFVKKSLMIMVSFP